MTSTKKKATKDDVEGHTTVLPKAIEDDVEGHTTVLPKAVEDDVEGHSILPNPNLSIQLAQARQRDMARDLKQHKLENESRKHNK